MSKPPRGPSVQATPISRECWARGLQTRNSPLSVERASSSGPTPPQRSRRGWDARCGPAPRNHQTVLCSLVLAASILAQPRGDTCPPGAPFVACHLCVIVLTWLQALPLCQISTAMPGK